MASLHHDIKNAPPELFEKGRWTVLTFLLIHANARNRCWPSMRYLAGRLGMSVTYVTGAKQWLIEHGAIEIVPFKQRMGLEKQEPKRQHIYQLTGILKFGQMTLQYFYVGSPETATDDVPPRDTSDDAHNVPPHEISPDGTSNPLMFQTVDVPKLPPLSISSIKESSISIEEPNANALGSADALPASPPTSYDVKEVEASLPDGQHEPEPQSEELKSPPPVPRGSPAPDKLYKHLDDGRYEGPYAPTGKVVKAGGTFMQGQALPATAAVVPPPVQAHIAIIDAYHWALPENRRAIGKPGYGRNAIAAKAIVEAGITPEQVARFVKETYPSYLEWAQQEAKRPLLMSLEHVKNNIRAWLAKDIVAVPAAPSPPLQPDDLELKLILFAILKVTGLDYRLVPDVLTRAQKYRDNGYTADDVAACWYIWRDANQWKLNKNPGEKPKLTELTEYLGRAKVSTADFKYNPDMALETIIRRIRVSGDFASIESGYVPELESGEEVL